MTIHPQIEKVTGLSKRYFGIILAYWLDLYLLKTVTGINWKIKPD